MIDYNKEIVAALKTIGIPVHYELFLNINFGLNLIIDSNQNCEI